MLLLATTSRILCPLLLLIALSHHWKLKWVAGPRAHSPVNGQWVLDTVTKHTIFQVSAWHWQQYQVELDMTWQLDMTLFFHWSYCESDMRLQDVWCYMWLYNFPEFKSRQTYALCVFPTNWENISIPTKFTQTIKSTNFYTFEQFVAIKWRHTFRFNVTHSDDFNSVNNVYWFYAPLLPSLCSWVVQSYFLSKLKQAQFQINKTGHIAT